MINCRLLTLTFVHIQVALVIQMFQLENYLNYEISKAVEHIRILYTSFSRQIKFWNNDNNNNSFCKFLLS